MYAFLKLAFLFLAGAFGTALLVEIYLVYVVGQFDAKFRDARSVQVQIAMIVPGIASVVSALVYGLVLFLGRRSLTARGPQILLAIGLGAAFAVVLRFWIFPLWLPADGILSRDYAMWLYLFTWPVMAGSATIAIARPNEALERPR